MRRTGRGASPDEGWAVIDLWKSDTDADACDARWGQDEATAEFMSFVDLGSVSSARYYERTEPASLLHQGEGVPFGVLDAGQEGLARRVERLHNDPSTELADPYQRGDRSRTWT